MKGSIFTNTTLKFAANTSEDIHTLCRQMGNCDSSFIAGLPRFLFAYYGPNMEKPLKVRFPHTAFDRMPRMSDAEYAELRDMSRKNYGYSQVQENAPPEDHASEDPPSALLRRRTTKKW